MRASRLCLVALLGSSLFAAVTTLTACSDDADNSGTGLACDDGEDNNGDGTKDFPDDPSCDGTDDETEDGQVSPACGDSRDNDGDGLIDFPYDPGCYAKQQDGEDDDCPDGPGCPQCSNNIDDDMNGSTDFPNDGGCMAASDSEEYTSNAIACGPGIIFDKIPFTGLKEGNLMAGAPSALTASCGGTGNEDVYEIRVTVPKVIVATTNRDLTTADTVLSLRSAMCSDPASELACNDNISTTDKQSTITVSISQPGTYFLIVDSKDAVGGNYELEVKYFVGEGTPCLAPDECGPGLVCRIPKGGTGKVCAGHVCGDGLDEDDDGFNDFPEDPGCTALDDDDEADTCPGVEATCPECGDGVDNDGDTKTDYGNNGDTTCTSASSTSESCVATEGVTALVMASTMDTTVGATNDIVLPTGCASQTGTAGDKTYRIDVPAMSSLTIASVNTIDASVALFDSSCIGTPLQCRDTPEDIVVGPLAAGTYYYVFDGYSTQTGAYTLNVSGTIAPNGSCESPLAQAGALTCQLGYACQGTVGSRTCEPAVCSDGIENDSPADNVIDYPLDPGCDGPADISETNPATLPACANNADDDGDGATDYPADFGCAAASSTTEVFCTGEVLADSRGKITTKTVTGTTTGATNNLTPTCGSSTATDVAYSLQLPVPVASLVLDTEATTLDTILSVRSLDCATAIACDDDAGISSGASKITLNGVAAGGYAIIVDGYSSGNGAYTLNVQGTVAVGTRCDSALFTGGAASVLKCPTGTTCTGAPIPKCM